SAGQAVRMAARGEMSTDRALLVDLYELTMAAAYFEHGIDCHATFVRFLRQQPAFQTVSPEFFDYLREFRFHGDVRAVEEGTLVFAEEPLLQVTAPVLEAQIAETYLLAVIHYETLVASKAARVVRAAGGRGVLEFGTRRAHGP